MSRVNVTIDRLVLNGFEPDQCQALVEALQGELSRALREPGAVSPRMRRTPSMALAPMPLDLGRAGSRKLGAGIGRAIGEGLKR